MESRHNLIEWLERQQVTFPIGTVAGERVTLGDVVDVGDWEEGEVEVETISIDSQPPPVLGDVTFNVESCIDPSHPNWQKVAPQDAQVLVNTGFANLRLKESNASNPWEGTRLRKHARLVFTHNSTTPHKITVRAALLLKKRTP